MGWTHATGEQIWGEYQPPPGAQNEEDDMKDLPRFGSAEWMEDRPWLKTAKSPFAPKPFLQQANGAGWQQWVWPAAIVGGAFLLFSALRR